MNVDDVMSCFPEPVPGLGSGKTYNDNGTIRLESKTEIPWDKVFQYLDDDSFFDADSEILHIDYSGQLQKL